MLDFDVEFIRKHDIPLMDCQVDLILKSLTMYSYVYKYVCPCQKSQTREEDLRIALVRDTIEQIYNVYTISKKEQNQVEKDFKDFEEEFLKNISKSS